MSWIQTARRDHARRCCRHSSDLTGHERGLSAAAARPQVPRLSPYGGPARYGESDLMHRRDRRPVAVAAARSPLHNRAEIPLQLAGRQSVIAR